MTFQQIVSVTNQQSIFDETGGTLYRMEGLPIADIDITTATRLFAARCGKRKERKGAIREFGPEGSAVAGLTRKTHPFSRAGVAAANRVVVW